MKKKITLLSAIICVNALNGMQEQPSYRSLLPELKQEIITTALRLSSDFDGAINTVEKLSALHGVQFDKITDSTKLIRILADKFNRPTHNVAKEFKTKNVAKVYLRLIEDCAIYSLLISFLLIFFSLD